MSEYISTSLTKLSGSISKITGGSNYIKIPVQGQEKPLLVQWGNTTGANPDVITLYEKYSSTDYSIAVCNTTGNNNTSDTYVKAKTTSNFTLSQYVAKSEGHSWITIGY